jgi:hypothetical protein
MLPLDFVASSDVQCSSLCWPTHSSGAAITSRLVCSWVHISMCPTHDLVVAL